MEPKDYYQILGVEKGAASKQIKTAYRELALKYHPDRNRDNPQLAERMKDLNEAYAVLSDAQKRREYDAIRQQYGSSAYRQFRSSYSEQDIFSGSDINHVFDDLARNFGYRGVDEIFREFYGQGYRHFEFRRPGMSARGFIYTGGFGPRRRRRHPHGIAPGANRGRLSRYLLQKISGIVPSQDGADVDDVIWLSAEHARQGGPFAYQKRDNLKKLVVNIPAGIRTGQRIRLAQMGRPGNGGGRSGDLYLKVRIKKPLLQALKNTFSKLLK